MKTKFNITRLLALLTAFLLGCKRSEFVFWPDMKWIRNDLTHSILSYQDGRFRWHGDLAVLITKNGYLISETAKNHKTNLFYVDLLKDQLIINPKINEIAEYKNELKDQHWFSITTLIGINKRKDEIRLFLAEIELLKRRIKHDTEAR